MGHAQRSVGSWWCTWYGIRGRQLHESIVFFVLLTEGSYVGGRRQLEHVSCRRQLECVGGRKMLYLLHQI
jgi:hypothetical protein